MYMKLVCVCVCVCVCVYVYMYMKLVPLDNNPSNPTNPTNPTNPDNPSIHNMVLFYYLFLVDFLKTTKQFVVSFTKTVNYLLCKLNTLMFYIHNILLFYIPNTPYYCKGISETDYPAMRMKLAALGLLGLLG